MSNLPGDAAIRERARLVRRAWWAVGWFGVALVIWLSLMHNPPRLQVENGDKLQHVAAYAALMLWFAQLLPRTPQRGTAAIALVGLGIAIEFVQGATGYREFSYLDMVADTAGVTLGWLLAPPRSPDLLAFAVRTAVGNSGSDSRI